jgi:hypothetical protein
MINQVLIDIESSPNRLGIIEIDCVYGIDHSGEYVDFDYQESHETSTHFSEESPKDVIEHVANWLKVPIELVKISEGG